METQFFKEKKPVNAPLIEHMDHKKKHLGCRPSPAFVSASWTALLLGWPPIVLDFGTHPCG